MINPQIRLAGILRLAVLATLGLTAFATTTARAQTYAFSTLYNFDGISGANPTSGVALDDSGEIYGTATGGGEDNHGEVFVIPSGGNTPFIQADFNQDGSNGQNPNGVTVQENGGTFGGNIYGTTSEAGSSSNDGTVFAIASAIGPITTLATFTGANGADPVGLLTVTSTGAIFGATSGGGANNDGTIFAIAGPTVLGGGGGIPAPNVGLTTSLSFDGTDGASPTGVLITGNGAIYGTTLSGGANGLGTVFEVGPSGISALASFSSLTGSGASALTVDRNGNLYGTTASGGADNDGTVFEIAAGTNTITTIASFNGANGADPGSAALAIDGHGNLYGTTQAGGGSSSDGTVFKIAAGTNSIISLASFDGANGDNPLNSSIAVDAHGNLYGTTNSGGSKGDGTVFKLSFTPPANLTWNGGGGDNNWSTGGNWIGNSAPGPAANMSVTFDGSTRLSPNIEQPYSVYSMTFASTAGAFTLTGGPVTIGDGGIVQNSATNLETIATSGVVLGSVQAWRSDEGGLTVSAPISGSGGLVLSPFGTITLTGNNSYTGGTIIAGQGTVSVGDGVSQSSSLGSGSVEVGGLSILNYTVNSSAGNAAITTVDTGIVDFLNSATAGASTITVGHFDTEFVLNDAAVEFSGSSTAASATINSEAHGFVNFAGNSTAGNSTINSSGQIEIDGAASLGNSHIDMEDSATLGFQTSTACAAGATIVNNSEAIGPVDISHATAGVSIGSLSGTGNVTLGGNTLTLGALGQNDTISGTISDNGILDPVGSVVKVGTGTLTLSGANAYFGATTVNAGTLAISGSGTYVLAVSNAAGATLDIESGKFFDVEAVNGGTANITGGTVSFVDSSTGGQVNISGGSIGTVTAGDPSTIDIYGGQFSGAIENIDPSESIIDIFGSDFSLTDPVINGADTDWTLTGTLLDGSAFDVEYVEAHNNNSNNNAAPARGITFNGAGTAPEPSALALLLSAVLYRGIVAARRKRHSGRRLMVLND